MVMVMELMVDGDEGGEYGGEDGLRIPPPGEKSWINLSPKTKIVVAATLCFAEALLLLGQTLFHIYEGVRENRRRGGARGPRWVGPRDQGIWMRGPTLSVLGHFLVSIFCTMSFFSIKTDVVFFSF